MNQKDYEFQVKEAGEDTPSITAYASTFDREPDSYGDVVARGAFADSLKKWEESGNSIPLLFGHRTDDPMMNIGKVTKAVEDERGLLIEAEFDMDNPNGAYAHKLVMEKRLCKLSFAFDVLDQGTVTLEDGTKANELRKMDIYEVSLVPIPANQHAEVVSAKDAPAETPEDSADGEKAGRRNSKADEEELNRISDLAGEIQEVVSGLTAAGDTSEPETDEEPKEEPAEAKSEQDDEPSKANEGEPEDDGEDEDETKPEKESNTMDKNIIDTIGKSAEGAADMQTAPAKSLGEFATKNLAGKLEKGGRFARMTPEFKASTDVQTIPSAIGPAIMDYDRNIVGVRKTLGLADLFATETIQGNALTYYVEQAVEGGYNAVAENGQKPQIHFADPVAKTVSLTKLAAFYKESDEIISDAQWLASSIDNRAVYLMDLKEEGHLLTTLLGTSGLGTLTLSQTGTITLPEIKKAKTAVKLATGMTADTVVINPTDYDKLIIGSLTEKYFVNPWGAEEPRLWGMAVYQSEEITEGTCLVGAFRQGASVIRKGGKSVEVANTNEDDFTNNRVTIRVEERLALAVRYPGAFCKVA